MKNLFSLIFVTIFLMPTPQAQELMSENDGFEDLNDMESGGFGAPVVKFTRLNERDAVLTGAKGSWIMNHNYALGGSAYVLSNNIDFPGYTQNLEFGYAGVNFDYIYLPLDKFIFTGGILLGAGVFDFDDNNAGSDGILVAEPEVSAQYQVTKNFRAALTASYRGIAGVDLSRMSNSKLSGFSYGLALNFGTF